MFFYLQIVVSIIMLFVLFFMRGGLENPIYSLLKLDNTKFNKIITKLRLYVPWNLFSGMDESFMDIKIISHSEKSSNIWFLRRDKRIGNYSFNTDLSSLTLTFYYKRLFYGFLNNFFMQEIKEFYHKNNEVCNSISIEVHWFSSLNEDSINDRIGAINIEPIFNWKK